MSVLSNVFVILTTVVAAVKAFGFDHEPTSRFSAIFANDTYEFSVDIFTRVAEVRTGNFVISPLSLWGILSVLFEGSSGRTYRELRRVLRHRSRYIALQYYSIFKQIFTTRVLSRVGMILIEATYRSRIYRSFANRIRRIGNFQIEVLPLDTLDSANRSAAIVNNHVRTGTHSTMGDVVNNTFLFEKQLVVIDAVFMNGFWRAAFIRSGDEPFFDEEGYEIAKVDLMESTNLFKILDVRDLNCICMELPYALTINGTLSSLTMYIFVPNEDQKLSNVLQRLHSFSLPGLMQTFRNRIPREATVKIPRFYVRTAMYSTIRSILRTMGLRRMFNKYASFKRMTSRDNLLVDSIIHRVSLDVTEHGSKATTYMRVAKGGFGIKQMPRAVVCNKPFLYFIMDVVDDVMVYGGIYYRPEQPTR